MQTCEKIPAVPATAAPGLHRELGLFEAISANMLEMIGVGPFLTIQPMNEPQSVRSLKNHGRWRSWQCSNIQSSVNGRLPKTYETPGPGAITSILATWKTRESR